MREASLRLEVCSDSETARTRLSRKHHTYYSFFFMISYDLATTSQVHQIWKAQQLMLLTFFFSLKTTQNKTK